MDEVAAAIETAALAEWARIRKREPWIKDTEDTRGAFVVGFARGTRFGMAINVKGIAEAMVDEARAHG